MSARTFYGGAAAVRPIPSGQWRSTPGALAAVTAVVALERAQLVWLPPGQAISAVGVYVNTGVASTDLRFGIRVDVNGAPGTLILDAGIVSASTGGAKTTAVSYTVPAGPASGVPLWLTVTPQGTNSVNILCTYSTVETRDFSTAAVASLNHGTASQAGVTGALPPSFSVGGTLAPGPLFLIQGG